MFLALPPRIELAEVEDLGQPISLHPAEASYVEGAIATRRRDFALGRFCARTALGNLGLDDATIARDTQGRPVWPASFVGSITHTKGYASALAARRDDFLCLGIDAERVGGVTDRLMPLLFDMAEQAWLGTFEGTKRSLLATVLFSAKEAYFKAWSAATGLQLPFPDLHIDLEADSFIATRPGAPDKAWRAPVTGSFAIRGDLVVTALGVQHQKGV